MKTKILITITLCFLSTSLGWAQDTVVFSMQGGFYNEVFSLGLYNYYPQNHIRYTTNGNRPTAQSPLYEEPLLMNEHLYSKSDIYTIQISPEDLIYIPDSVQHCIVIRAAVFDENDSCVGSVVTNSYFIRSLGCDTHGLPVVSLCADSLDLFDYHRGIMVPGVWFDSLNPNYTGNYYNKGIEWERLVNVEFRELDNVGINHQAGLRTHGKQARRQVQKGLKLYAREEYGKKRFRYRFFEEIPQNSFKHLTLKPFASSWNGCGVADYLSNCIARQLNLETVASRPVVLFLNGEFWGIYFLEEKPDERYLEDHFNIDIETVNIMEDWNGHFDYGSPNNFNVLFSWMQQADLSDDTNFAYAADHIDIDNFIDYQIFEIFSHNMDWPANNVRFWQLGNGMFRWIFFDGDACFQSESFDAFANAIYDGEELYPSSRRSTLFFRKLLENNNFKNRFVERFKELLRTVFAYENTLPFYDEITMTVKNEIPLQSFRFGKPSSFSTWYYYSIYVVNDFLMAMPVKITDELSEMFAVPETTAVKFVCYPNPSTDIITLGLFSEFADKQCIEVYDMDGRCVYHEKVLLGCGMNHLTLQIQSELPPGVYVLRIGERTQRIVRY